MSDTNNSQRWSLLDDLEIHAFGIDSILPYIVKSGVTIQGVNRVLDMNPQIVGERWGSPAFIYVRTALYPGKGELPQDEFFRCINWAAQHRATAFFASVGLACINYPDRSPVMNDADMRLPIRNGGFAVSYQGLQVMTTSDRVSMLDEGDQDAGKQSMGSPS